MMMSCRYLLVVTAVCSLIVYCEASSEANNDEKRLLKHLLTNYEHIGTLGRPVHDSNDPVKVNISLGLIELTEFDVEEQEMILVGWTALEWFDVLLKWEPADFSDVTSLSLGSDMIWTPDIILTNALSKPEMLHDALVQVTNEGKVKWVDTYKYHFYCKIPAEDIDADKFNCHMAFGSWTMGSDSLLLHNKGDRFDAEYYVSNREWEFYKNKAVRMTMELPWGTKSSQVKYTFTLKRRNTRDADADAESSAPLLMSSLAFLMLLLSKLVF